MFSTVMSRLTERRDAAVDMGEDAGFTLIELMVVLLILAILLAIAIPTFLGVTGGANDRATQTNLNTGITALKTQATQNSQSYGAGTAFIPAATMSKNEPALTWLDSLTVAQNTTAVAAPVTTATAGNSVSFSVSPDGNGVVEVGFAKGGTTANSCWYIVDNLAAVGSGTPPTNYSATGTATTYPAAPGTYYAKAATNATSPLGCDPGVAPVGASTTSAVSPSTTWGSKF